MFPFSALFKVFKESSLPAFFPFRFASFVSARNCAEGGILGFSKRSPFRFLPQGHTDETYKLWLNIHSAASKFLVRLTLLIIRQGKMQLTPSCSWGD